MTPMGKVKLYVKVGWRAWVVGYAFIAISIMVMQAIGVTSPRTENIVSAVAFFVGLLVGSWWASWSFKQLPLEGIE